MSYDQTTRNRQTGRPVTVCTAEDAGADPDGGKWVSICDDHGYLINSDTLELACLSKPFDFCDACQWLHGGPEYKFGEYQTLLLQQEHGDRLGRPATAAERAAEGVAA